MRISRRTFHSHVAMVLIAAMSLISLPAQAAIVDTGAMLALDAGAGQQPMDAVTARESVAAQLIALGVAPDQIDARLAALSAADMQRLATALDEQPAGGSTLGVIGVVFVVLLVLELMGITNIFRGV
jgi:hypothetical protein